MKKAQLPIFAELSLGDTQEFTSKPIRKFTGTENPRHLRVIHALLTSPLTREQLDRIVAASNGPDLVAELRRRGLLIPCLKPPVIDLDGRIVQRGVYAFIKTDRRQVYEFLAQKRRAT